MGNISTLLSQARYPPHPRGDRSAKGTHTIHGVVRKGHWNEEYSPSVLSRGQQKEPKIAWTSPFVALSFGDTSEVNALKVCNTKDYLIQGLRALLKKLRTLYVGKMAKKSLTLPSGERAKGLTWTLILTVVCGLLRSLQGHRSKLLRHFHDD
ncbi:hypothetical protein Tco_0090654 [Tanacetum coccineum]